MVQANSQSFTFLTFALATLSTGYAAPHPRVPNLCSLTSGSFVPMALSWGPADNPFDSSQGEPLELFLKSQDSSDNLAEYVLGPCPERNCTIQSNALNWTLTAGSLDPNIPGFTYDQLLEENSEVIFNIYSVRRSQVTETYCVQFNNDVTPVESSLALYNRRQPEGQTPDFWLCDSVSLTSDDLDAPKPQTVWFKPNNPTECSRKITVIARDAATIEFSQS